MKTSGISNGSTATEERPELARLNTACTGYSDPHYLSHRALFPALRHSARYAQGDLLDIGCGNKPYLSVFEPGVRSYTGCDVAQSSMQLVDVICDATSIPRPDASFDTVLSTQAIEHVADHRGMIREAVRLLRPDGHLIVSGPMYWCLHEEPYDFFRFTAHGFKYLVESAGLKAIEIIPNGGPWAVCGLALIHALGYDWRKRRRTLALINRIFAKLDDRCASRVNTTNYVVIARKPS